jgi:hypoxanthine phosphoribosyltransferase
MELYHYERHAKRVAAVSQKLPLPTSNILIVDDAVDSGHSVLSVANLLVSLGFVEKNLRVAVINTTCINPVIDPDYVCFRNTMLCFPWSRDSLERGQYLKMLPEMLR